MTNLCQLSMFARMISGLNKEGSAECLLCFCVSHLQDIVRSVSRESMFSHRQMLKGQGNDRVNEVTLPPCLCHSDFYGKLEAFNWMWNTGQLSAVSQ